MTVRTAEDGPAGADAPGFRHELYPYGGPSAFLTGTLSFIEDALTGGESVVVAVSPSKQEKLRAELAGNGSGPRVSFVDTAALGRNPGRLIPAWRDWVTRSVGDGIPVRGISEPPWEGRTPGERGELQYHDWLVNLAFANSAWWLLCPYDTTAVESAAVDTARRCHPFRLSAGVHGPNPDYADEPWDFPELTAACDPDQELLYEAGELAAVRDKMTACADRYGLTGERLRELLVAATEVAANSVKYGGGHGTLRIWTEGDDLVCEFHDAGHIRDPLAGRTRPAPRQTGGRGMWLVHQLCDLVQIRSTAEHGTTIRLHTSLR